MFAKRIAGRQLCWTTACPVAHGSGKQVTGANVAQQLPPLSVKSLGALASAPSCQKVVKAVNLICSATLPMHSMGALQRPPLT